MRGKKALCIILTGMSVLSCGLRPQKSASPRFTPQDAGYTGKLLPTFYYTEGMKRGMLYGDPEGAVKIFDKAIAADSTHAPSYYEAAPTPRGPSRTARRPTGWIPRTSGTRASWAG